MSIERGSDKHGPRLDDALAGEVRSTLSARRETHVEESRQAEPSGEDEPAVDSYPADVPHGGIPDGMTDEDIEERSELAGWLHRRLFPAVREVLVDEVVGNDAPDHVVDEVKRLPAGREFTGFGDVWRTLHGGGHVEDHRF